MRAAHETALLRAEKAGAGAAAAGARRIGGEVRAALHTFCEKWVPPAADPEKDPVAALGLLASTPLLDRRAQPSPPPRYRSLSKPNSPQKEKTDQWEGV